LQGYFGVILQSGISCTRIVLKNFVGALGSVFSVTIDGVTLTPSAVSTGGLISGTNISRNPAQDNSDFTIDFPAFSGSDLRIVMGGTGFSGPQQFSTTEIQVFTAAYHITGKFTSKTLDLGLTPTSLGTLNATETLNGEFTSYFTQSSADGISWDAEVSVSDEK